MAEKLKQKMRCDAIDERRREEEEEKEETHARNAFKFKYSYHYNTEEYVTTVWYFIEEVLKNECCPYYLINPPLSLSHTYTHTNQLKYGCRKENAINNSQDLTYWLIIKFDSPYMFLS